MANGKIYQNDRMGYAVAGYYIPTASVVVNGNTITSRFLLPYPQSNKQTQYLHNDGQWHWSPQHDHDNTQWPGYWKSEEEALQALNNAPEPTHYIDAPITPVCRVCHTLAPEGLDNHTHYSPGLRMNEVLQSMRTK